MIIKSQPSNQEKSLDGTNKNPTMMKKELEIQ